jgi:hypothetical protein
LKDNYGFYHELERRTLMREVPMYASSEYSYIFPINPQHLLGISCTIWLLFYWFCRSLMQAVVIIIDIFGKVRTSRTPQW